MVARKAGDVPGSALQWSSIGSILLRSCSGRFLDIKRLFMQSRSALGESGGAPFMSKGMSRKSPLGVGCWKRTDGNSKASTGVPSNGLEEGVTATSERLEWGPPDFREGSLPYNT